MKRFSLAARSPRERRILIAAAALGIPMLVWLSIWQPLLKMRADAEQKVAQSRVALEWMQRASAQVKSLRGQPSAGQPRGAPNQRITRAAQVLQLSISRIEPAGNNRFNLWLADADYKNTVRFLDTLQQQGFNIDSLTMAQQGGPGMVSVRMSIEATL